VTSNFLSSPIDSVAVCGSDAISIVAVVAVVPVTPTWCSWEFISTFSLCFIAISFVKDSVNCSFVRVCVPAVQNVVVLSVLVPPPSYMLSVITVYVAEVLSEFPAKSVTVQE